MRPGVATVAPVWRETPRRNRAKSRPFATFFRLVP